MQKLFLFLFLMGATAPLLPQPLDVQVKVYQFEEGLSHRNTFKILQDTAGFIWLATINGLNRFDGYEFVQYNSQQERLYLPHDVISDMLIDEQNRIWLASPDYLTLFHPGTGRYDEIKLKTGAIVQRESIVPHSLSLSTDGRAWMALYDEKSAGNTFAIVDAAGKATEVMDIEGQYARRPNVWAGGHRYVAAYGQQLWQLDAEGRVKGQINLPASRESRITQLQAVGDSIYILCMDGQLLSYNLPGQSFSKHPASLRAESATALLIEPDGDIWIGGRGLLRYYDQKQRKSTDYNRTVTELIKNTATYRQIFRDNSGVIWAASDFGAVKIVQSARLFTQYLSDGSEYCSNVYCSTRGITEDEQGNIYISYYNSIHQLNPRTNSLRLLFPSNNFFNSPFGLAYHKGALWTGNGRRIDLKALQVDTLFDHPSKDLGAVMADRDSVLWIGYLQWLYQYDPQKRMLVEFEDDRGKWDSLDGNISYLYQGKTKDWIWVATLSNGIFCLQKGVGRIAHYHDGPNSTIKLSHNQVNSIYEGRNGLLWLATASGLNCLDLRNNKIKVYTTQDGLPNDFINGILPEGDSCLWISTDNGLSRFSLLSGSFSNFFLEDGISANEFNRISFYKARNGRMYFGGLNGVNAFFPGTHFLEKKEEEQEANILLTQFSKYDGSNDSIVIRAGGLAPSESIVLSPWDRIFSFQFALADFRKPLENEFSFILEGFDKEWSAPSTSTLARYNNIPAGRYTFRVRAKAGTNTPQWNSRELAIPVVVKEAFYNTLWFWLIVGLLLAAAITGFIRYRIYLAKKREKALEELVRERTQELELEKQKSEELLLNILPMETAEELKKFGAAKAKRHELVTVMFSDFKGFSRISEQMDPEDLVAEIDYCFRAFDEVMERYGLEKIKTVGDAYLCVGGMRADHSDEATRVILAALEIQEFMDGIRIQRELEDKPFFEARIGIHTGPVVAGIVGIKKFAYDIWGDTVNLASRMETNGEAGKVNISETTFSLVREVFRCTYQGQYTETDGEDIRMYFVDEYLERAPVLAKRREGS